jgi:hypothetical protein
MAEAKRNVIFHYHFFKNAGTSVDELLKANFPGCWVGREFSDGNAKDINAQVMHWVEDEVDAVAFSSHTATLPPPHIDGVRLFPVVFLRHPVDRIVSAYTFERRQGSASLGSVIARNTSLAGYIEIRLALHADRQCRNFHVARLSQMYPATAGDELTRALRAVEELPFVGLVENFDASIAHLTELLAPDFPGFRALPVASNISRDLSTPLAERLANVEQEIGETLYRELLNANADDLVLFEQVKARYVPPV